MKIKLKAKLCAYSKVHSLGNKLPTISQQDNGKVLGIHNNEYQLFDKLEPASIDNLFKKPDTEQESSKDIIDSMFD